MKIRNIILLCLCLILSILSACKEQKEEEIVLPEHVIKRNNIVGMWSSKTLTREFRQDTLYDEYSAVSNFDYTFQDNGTGDLALDNLGNNFEWLYQYNPQKIVLTFPIFDVSTIYEITKNEEDRQIWETEETIIDSTGVETLFKRTLQLNRK